jgi:hypothetical protein
MRAITAAELLWSENRPFLIIGGMHTYPAKDLSISLSEPEHAHKNLGHKP